MIKEAPVYSEKKYAGVFLCPIIALNDIIRDMEVFIL